MKKKKTIRELLLKLRRIAAVSCKFFRIIFFPFVFYFFEKEYDVLRDI